MTPQLRAELDVLPGWESFEFAGAIGAVRHVVADRGLHPNVIVTLDKWAGSVSASDALDLVTGQLRSAGATVRATRDLSDAQTVVEIQTEEPGDELGQVRVRYRLNLIPVANDTLVVTGIATCREAHEAVLTDDIDRILGSIQLRAHGNADA